MKTKDALTYLYFDRLDSDEVSQVLLNNTPGRREDALSHVYQWPTTGHWIRVDYSKKRGTVSGIAMSNGFPQSELTRLRKLIEDTLVSGQIKRVAQMVAFAYGKPVAGARRARCRDFEFQILPIDSAAPRPAMSQGDYPFILEVEYVGCSDLTINAIRIGRSAVTTARMLNLFLNSTIALPSNSSRWEWVVDAMGSGHTTWQRIGYAFPLEPLPTSVLSNIDNIPPLPMVAPENYYSMADAGLSGQELALPAIFDAQCGRFAALSEEEYSRFYIAVTWFAHARDLSRTSRSSTFNALVSAIESLLPKESERCKQCNQEIYKIGERFRSFLDTYAPGPEEAAARRELLTAFYKTRSGIAHGLSLLQRDLEPWHFGGAKGSREDELLRQLFRIVRIALLNWLGGRGGTDREQLPLPRKWSWRQWIASFLRVLWNRDEN